MSDLFVLDKNSHIPIFSEICTFCRHLDVSGERRCAAFPQDIPLPIWLGENDHHLPYPGDHNIQFAPTSMPALVQETLSSMKLDKRNKVRKRRFLIRPSLLREAELQMRFWQDPQIQERVTELLKSASNAAEAKRVPSVEAHWLSGTTFKAKTQRRKQAIEK